MSDLVLKQEEPIRGPDGRFYVPRVCGSRPEPDGLWRGWIEFVVDGQTESIATAAETTQPNQTDLVYWAHGLTRVYFEGALARALARPVSGHVV